MTFIPKDKVDDYLAEKRKGNEPVDYNTDNNRTDEIADYENQNPQTQDTLMRKIRNLVGRESFVMAPINDLLCLEMMLEIIKDDDVLKRKLEDMNINEDTLIENLRKQVRDKRYAQIIEK